MSEKNKVKVTIASADYVVVSEDSEEYVQEIAGEVSRRIDDMMRMNPRLSGMMASVLVALDYCDEYKKMSVNCDNLRMQLKDYLEDSSKARLETDEARREIERLTKEVSALRMRLAGN